MMTRNELLDTIDGCLLRTPNDRGRLLNHDEEQRAVIKGLLIACQAALDDLIQLRTECEATEVDSILALSSVLAMHPCTKCDGSGRQTIRCRGGDIAERMCPNCHARATQ